MEPLTLQEWNLIESIQTLSTRPHILQKGMYVCKVCSLCWKSVLYPHYFSSSEMHQPKANCSELVLKTAEALDSEVLQQLLISTQRNNLALCKQFAIEKWVSQALKETVKPKFLIMCRAIVPEMIKRNSWLGHIRGLKSEEIIDILVSAWRWFPYNPVSKSNGLPQVQY